MAVKIVNPDRKKSSDKSEHPRLRRPEKPTKPTPSNDQPPPPGLDGERHAAAQRHSHQAEFLRKGIFPSLMATALGLDQSIDTPAYSVYLDQILEESGNPSDPVEAMLIEHLCLAHFRIAQLHASAGQSQGIEATKILNSVAARMLGEFRRMALTLKAYRGEHHKERPAEKVKLFKAAQ